MATFQADLRCFAAAEPGDGEQIEIVRGVSWVLRWAAAIAVLGVTAVILLDFAYRLAAEQTLAHAAAVGIREAAMPRATSRTVEQSIRQALGKLSSSGRSLKIAMTLAGKPWRSSHTSEPVASMMITLSLPVAEAMPNWLRVISPATDGVLTIRSERLSGET